MSDRSSNKNATEGRLWLICASVLFLILLFRTVTHASWNINHDCAMYVTSGQLLLAGKLPYADFVDLNPPLIFYLNFIPAFLSKQSGLSVIGIFEICIWLSAAASAFCCLWLNANVKRDRGETDYLPSLLFGFAMFNFLTGEWGEFGQRQHLAALGLMPFFVCRWLRHMDHRPGAAASIAAGTMLGITLCLVPQYALIPIALEGFWSFASRRTDTAAKQLRKLLTPETIAALACFAVYAAHFIMLPNTVKEPFFNRWLPVVAKGYCAYNCDWTALTIFPMLIGCFPLLIAGAALAKFHRCSLTVPLLIWCIAAYVSAVVQLKGWYNHYLPFLAGTCLLVSTQVRFGGTYASTRIPKSMGKQIMVALGVFFLCTAPTIILRKSLSYPTDVTDTILKETKVGDSVIFISPNVPDIYPPLLATQRVNGSRYLFFFSLEIYRYLEKHSPDKAARDEAEREQQHILLEIKEDIDKSKPTLIFIPDASPEEKTKSEKSQPGKPPEETVMQWLVTHDFLPFLEQTYTKIGTCKGRSSYMSAWKLKYPH